MEFGSEDLADLSKTTRVLTIMLAEDWRGGLLLADFRGEFPKTTPKLLLRYGNTGKKRNPHIDGDTLEIQGQRIRLHRIDALEGAQTCYRDDRRAAFALPPALHRHPAPCRQSRQRRRPRPKTPDQEPAVITEQLLPS